MRQLAAQNEAMASLGAFRRITSNWLHGKRNVIATALSWLLAAIFCYAAIDKVYHYPLFIRTFGDYPFISDQAAKVLALPLILLELATAAGLVIRSSRLASSLIAGCLFILFASAYVIGISLNMDMHCACWFSLPAPRSPSLHAGLNLALASASFVIWKIETALHPAAAAPL